MPTSCGKDGFYLVGQLRLEEAQRCPGKGEGLDFFRILSWTIAMLGYPSPLSCSLQTSWRQWWRSLPGSYMMRPFVRLCPWISHNRSLRKDSIVCSRHSSSSSLSILLGLLRGSLLSVWQLSLPCHPPRLLSLLPTVGRGRNFKVSSPPSQLQVEGVLGQHWPVWQSFSTDKWTVAALQDGYRVLFHRLPHVLLEPQERSSFSPGAVPALVL